MKKIFLIFIIWFLPFSVYAEETAIVLEKAKINVHDLESVKRGAKLFATVCMACHTLVYLRYDALANEAGVKYEKMPVNIKEWPFGVKPPDLSLEADFRGVDWIYTYLHSFYEDKTQPTGLNNLLVVNSKMTGILVPMQGILIKAPSLVDAKKIYTNDMHWYDLLILQKQGSMSPEEYDATVNDVVNFLAYAANPYQSRQHQIGCWVIGFLLLLFLLTFLLKKSYWQDIKNRNE